MSFGGSRDEHSGRPFGADIVRMANGLIRRSALPQGGSLAHGARAQMR